MKTTGNPGRQAEDKRSAGRCYRRSIFPAAARLIRFLHWVRARVQPTDLLIWLGCVFDGSPAGQTFNVGDPQRLNASVLIY